MDISYANYFPSVFCCYLGTLVLRKWRSSNPVCWSCCTACGSEQHQAEVLKKFYRSLIETRRLWRDDSACELLDWRSALETSHADAHKSVEDVIISGFIQSGTHTTPWITQWKTRARTRARTSLPPLPVLEISTRNRFSPLGESERDATVIMGTSMVRHVCATSGKDKVRTHCFPGAHVLDVAAQVPEILNGDERVRAVVLNVGANNIRLRF
ncbi:hypothetical protein F2P79_019961 [Pimephales promelas]|nr:hypothetical protein F2P79_019961 [Pimephales promelas]